MSEENKKHRGKLKRIIAGVAPKLAHTLGGPLAGAAVSQISNVVFGKGDIDEDALVLALAQATPEQLLALKKAEQEFAVALRAQDVAALRVDADDRASARAREIELRDRTPSVLGGLIIFGFFAVLAVMVLRQIPVGAETEFSIMLGALATMTAAVVNYFFGSSSGSKQKTRLMALPPDHD